MLILALVLCPAAIGMGYFGWKEHQLASATERSTCDVLGVSNGSGDDANGSLQPWVILVHTVAGERFERRDVGPTCDTIAEADELVAGLRPGARVLCRYPMGRPSLVTYFEHSGTRAQLLLAGAAASLLVLLAAALWARRTRRAKGD